VESDESLSDTAAQEQRRDSVKKRMDKLARCMANRKAGKDNG